MLASAVSGASGQDLTDITVAETSEHEIQFRSGQTVYVEALLGDQWVGRCWNADGRNKSPYWPAAEPAFSIALKEDPKAATGTKLSSGWQWMSGAELAKTDRGARHFVVELSNKLMPVHVKVHTLLDGTAVLTRWLEIANNAVKSIALAEVSPWAGRLWAEDAPVTLGHSIADAGGQEGSFGWSPLSPGINVFKQDQGLLSDDPYFVLRNEANGDYFFGQLAWSANYKMEFQKASGLTFQIGPTATAALRVIAPAETVTTPAVHLGRTKGDFDAAVQAMHEHIRRSVLPTRKPERSYLIQYQIPEDWDISLYRADQFNETNMHKSIDVAAAVGCELFLLDGPQWCPAYGNWLLTDPKRFPRGLGPLVEHARRKGLLFGLYAEPEGGRDGFSSTYTTVGATMGKWKESKVFQQHPDWFSPARPDWFREPGSTVPVLNLSIPEAAAYFESELAQIVEHHQLDLYRHDFNARRCGQGSETRRDGFVENDYWRHYDALHEAFACIHAKCPNLILQQAAAGGCRSDLGTAGVFHEQFTSDNAKYPSAYRMLSGFSVFLPPESIAHANGMAPSKDLPDLDTTLRCAFAAGNTPMIFHALLPKSVEELKPETRTKCLHHADIYKRFIRPLLATCKVYHHAPVNATGGIDSGQWFAMEFTSPDKTKAWALVVRFPKADSNQYVFTPNGLDGQMKYRVTSDNTDERKVVKGSDLMRDGVDIRLDAAQPSELLLLEARQWVVAD